MIMQPETMILSLLTGLFVGLAAGYLGSLMVLEKMALVGDALSHVALPGLALGIIFHFEPFIGAFTFLFISAAIVWQIRRMTKLSFDTIIGALFTFTLAIGILLLQGNELELLEALFGDISNISIATAFAGILFSIIAIFLTKKIYNQLVLGMISEDLASSKGIKVGRINLLYLLLVSLIVAMGITIVGTLLVGFLVIVPAAAAKNLSNSLARYAILSGVFGALSALFGIAFSAYVNIQPGPVVVLVGISVFITTVLIKWKTK
jgi:ABC-type Mn2+/Zn2+ transport system permease subunit